MYQEKRLTKEYLKKFLRKDFKLYYSTPYLNDCLYLHYKGFERIENLEEFTGLKVIYLEGNGFNKIEGLDQLINMRCLYLQENLIQKIENLHFLQNLVILNLSDNSITKIENLEQCSKLQTLQIKRNRIGLNGISDLEGLLQLPELSVLDISDNKIEDQDVLVLIFEQIKSLAVLYFQNNPAVKYIKNYRKLYINNIKNLKFLDDRPVFPEERRFAQAFMIGGMELERAEREKYKKEQEDEHMRNHIAFRNMMNYNQQAQTEEQKQLQAQQQIIDQQQQQQEEEELQIQQSSDSENQSSKTYTHLSTYNTQSIQQQSQDDSQKELSRVCSSQSLQSLKSEEIEINKVDWNLQEIEQDKEQKLTRSQDLDELD